MEEARPTLSVIIPVFNEEETLPELDRRLRGFLGEIGETWEVIFVDDGSRDGSGRLLQALAEQEPRYRVVTFGRNFGHQMAITAGMDRAEGEAVVVMDADLQDPPEVVRDMLARWRQGFDVVYAVRQHRLGETWFKRVSASIFYRLFRAMLGFDVTLDAGDFRLMSRPVVLTLRSLRERHRFIRGLVGWVGFRQSSVSYTRHERFAGVTKYPLRKMLGFAFDGITSFSTLPLRMATWLGAFAGLLAMGLGAWAFYVRTWGDTAVPGWTTIMILVALGSSVQLLVIGILGAYVGRIFEEVQRRPLYTVARETNFAVRDGQSRPRAPAAAPTEAGEDKRR
ncbi:MAG: glycosyltransferase family 2 protein [Deltaproteobacteria bacterium]|nr:glycosyltransferase family 2 protein [Deltaproteobacteria bacterium]